MLTAGDRGLPWCWYIFGTCRASLTAITLSVPGCAEMERAWPVRLLGSYAHSQAGRAPSADTTCISSPETSAENANSRGFWTGAGDRSRMMRSTPATGTRRTRFAVGSGRYPRAPQDGLGLHLAGCPSHRLAERSGIVAGISNGFDPIGDAVARVIPRPYRIVSSHAELRRKRSSEPLSLGYIEIGGELASDNRCRPVSPPCNLLTVQAVVSVAVKR